MKVNLKLSNEEKQEILENHNIFKKVLLEKKKNQIIVEGFDDEVRVLRKALDTPCKETAGASLKKTKGGKAILYVQSSPKSDTKNNYAVGDMIIYYADKGTEPYTYLAKSKNPTTKKVKDFNWVCVKQGGTSPVDLYATQEIVQGDVQQATREGWVEWKDAQGFDFSQEGVTYAKKIFSDGVIRYKDLKSSKIQAGATTSQQEIIDYVNGIYGDNKGGKKDWSFDKPTQSLGWMFITVPDPNNKFPEKINIWVSPASLARARTATSATVTTTTQQTKLTNDDCKTEIQKYFDLYIQYENEPDTINSQEFTFTKKNVKRCRISFCGTGSLYCESGNRFNGLGNEYDRYIDFFMGRKELNVGRKKYGYLQSGHPFRID